jgi:hypothetical protein
MELDARKYEEARQALLKQAGDGADDSNRQDIEHAT